MIVKLVDAATCEVLRPAAPFLGRILLVPSLFSRLSSVFDRLQNPVLLVLSSENGTFRRPSKPSAS